MTQINYTTKHKKKQAPDNKRKRTDRDTFKARNKEG